MEWVETTAKTMDEAKDAALDQLGVDEQDAEFEVLEEPKQGLFGRMRGEARVRARVRPTRPRPKVERRDRRRGRSGSGKGRGGSPAEGSPTTTVDDDNPAAESTAPPRRREGGRRGGARSDRPSPSAKQSTEPAPSPATTPTTGAPPMETDEINVDAQAEIISSFLEGLVDAFGLDGEVEQEKVDDETIELRVNGDDLGLLIGPKGQTLAALQELSRTVAQRSLDGPARGRVRLDVGGYRQRRKEALQRFTRSVAEEVKSSGMQKALEPMASPDRKIVHDTANEIDGVRTISEGEEPRRRVVLLPDS